MRRAQVHSNANPVALAAELRPLLARNAGQAERDRRLPQENIDALEAANLFKLMTPRRQLGAIFGAKPYEQAATFDRACTRESWHRHSHRLLAHRP
jgi:hypothetical protein